MSNYSPQYQSYYDSLIKEKNNNKKDSLVKNKINRSTKGNWYIRRITRELIGVFILMCFVLTCKVIVTPQTKAAYNYSKQLINQKYDYNKIVAEIKNTNWKSMEDKVVNWIDQLKVKIGGGETIKQSIRNNFKYPIGENTSLTVGCSQEDSDKVTIKGNTKIEASYKGKVKSCGENDEFGKYIVINHGEGIETRYSNLKSISVKENDVVNKGQIIGNANTQSFKFEILYMGNKLSNF